MIYTRLTTKLMSDNIIENLLNNRGKLNQLQEQLSSGKRISTPSEDPTATMNILSDQTILSQNENFTENINNAIAELEVTDKSILTVIDIVHRAKELTVQAANATSGTDQLAAINNSIKQLINQVRDIGNSQYSSKYIFGGLNTENPPFQNVGTTNPEIRYNGTAATGNYQRKTEINQNVTIDMNIPGDEVFGQYYQSAAGPPPVYTGSGLIKTLVTLSEELGTSPPDYDAIRSKIGNLDTDLSTLLNAQSQIGGTLAILENTKSKLSDDTLTYTKRKSELQDIDLAKTISDIQFQENALQVSLSVGAKVIQSNLLDYLK